MAISLGSETRGLISRVKESLSGTGGPLAPADIPATNFMPMESPYVELGDRTAMKFVYGISEYGGEDIIASSFPQRYSLRYFLTIK